MKVPILKMISSEAGIMLVSCLPVSSDTITEHGIIICSPLTSIELVQQREHVPLQAEIK